MNAALWFLAGLIVGGVVGVIFTVLLIGFRRGL